MDTIFPSEELSLQVFSQDNGDFTYQTEEMQTPKLVEASIPEGSLIDVSRDENWIAFQRGMNIFLLDLKTHEINQISLNLHVNWSWLNYQIKFSPNSKYLLYEIGKDGIGQLDVCIYEVKEIDFEAIELEREKFYEDYNIFNLVDQCYFISGKMEQFIEEKKILPLVNRPVIDVYDSAWNKDGDLIFSTNLGHKNQRWTLNLEDWSIKQIEGDSITTPPFSDMMMDDPDMEHVLAGMKAGWLNGYPDGTVRLDQTMSKIEFAKIAVQAFQVPEQEIPESGFCKDLPRDAWYSKSYYTMYFMDVIYSPIHNPVLNLMWFCSKGTISKIEAIRAVLELDEWGGREVSLEDLEYADTYGTPYEERIYTGFSRQYDLILPDLDGNLYPKDPISRREAIRLVNHAWEIRHVWRGHG